MTAWNDLVATGVGGDQIEFRLVIEGAPYEICTTMEMAGACTEEGQDGKTRVPGLLREGLGFSESAYLAGADLSISINAIRIIETPAPYLDAVTSMFTSFANVKTYLAASLLADDTTASVMSEDDLEEGEVYHVGTEAIRMVTVVSSTPTIERAQWRTTAQKHATTITASPVVRPIRDGINIWTGRRCWLYAHGRNELSVGDVGELVWRGRLSDEPQLDGGDGVVWNLALESRWSLFDQELGTIADAIPKVSGIYYPAGHELAIYVAKCASASKATAASDPRTGVTIRGFYKDQDKFCAAVTDALNSNTTIASWGIAFVCMPIGDRWELYVTTASVDPRFISVTGGSYCDGSFVGELYETRLYDEVGGAIYDVGPRPGDLFPRGFDTIAANKEYLCMWSSAASRDSNLASVAPSDWRKVPRTNAVRIRPARSISSADLAANPAARIYLESVAGIAVGDTLMVTQPADDSGETPEPRSYQITTVENTASYVDAYGTDRGIPTVTITPNFVTVGNSGPELSFVKRYDSDGITVEDFRAALVAAAPDGANDGTTPWILDDDVASWSTAVANAANGNDFLENREYVYYSGVRLSDVLKHEARLYGLFFYLDSEFKIGARPLTLDTQQSGYSLNDSDGTLLTGSGFGELKSGMDGNVNTVEISLGYDPKEDKHVGGTITVVSVSGVSEAKKRHVLDIKPKSRALGGEISVDYAYRLADPVRTLFGSKILHYTFHVPITFWPVLVGDTVLVTSSTMPYDGARTVHDPGQGMIARRGLVVGREWDLAEGTGKLTLLVSGVSVSGYAPTGRVSSASGSGTSWTLTLESNHYAPAGQTDAGYFNAGDAIRIMQWDASSPITRVGVIASVSGNDISVTLTSSWTGLGGNIYNIMYQDSTQITSATQKQYTFIADNAGRVAWFSGSRNAYEFAP